MWVARDLAHNLNAMRRCATEFFGRRLGDRIAGNALPNSRNFR